VGKRCLRTILVGLLFGAGAVVMFGCTDPSTLPTNLPLPGTYLRDDIPAPFALVGIQGGYQYLGNGRFVQDSGREFFWRDGRYVNADGSPIETIDAQPAAAVAHYPTPALDASPRQGVSLTVTLGQWDYIVYATVRIRNESGSPFRFANKDLRLYVNGTPAEQTNPDLKPFEIPSGAGTEFRTDVYFMVDQFDSASAGLLYKSSDRKSRDFVASDGPTP
jgi:hypothetical protein